MPRAKHVCFISSTSALDTPHYVSLSERLTASHSPTGILESDELDGAQQGLSTGYGQSKWVGEYLMREAGRRGLSGVIVRPGYVLGGSKHGSEYHIPTVDSISTLFNACLRSVVQALPQRPCYGRGTNHD